MRQIDFKNIPITTVIIVGVLASAISFIYYFALKNPYEFIFWLICIVDFALFTLNAYLIVAALELSKVKTVIFTILTMVAFFVFCEAVVLAFTQGSSFEYNWELFFNVLRFSLFLSPSLILLLPIIWFIAEVLG